MLRSSVAFVSSRLSVSAHHSRHGNLAVKVLITILQVVVRTYRAYRRVLSMWYGACMYVLDCCTVVSGSVIYLFISIHNSAWTLIRLHYNREHWLLFCNTPSPHRIKRELYIIIFTTYLHRTPVWPTSVSCTSYYTFLILCRDKLYFITHKVLWETTIPIHMYSTDIRN